MVSAVVCLLGAGALAQDAKPPVSKGGDEASKLINAWHAGGKAAGLDGVYYDNRDRKHSDLPIATYPALKPIEYTAAELEQRADWGGQGRIFPGKVIVGNSSTASPANQAGSHQRMYYVHPLGLPFLYQQYRTHALYIYPEHRDHDPGVNGPDGYGDLYPANSPYLITSQGSSGTDRPFMHAFVKTIAAFPPDTREALTAKGLLMPALQAIFRRTYKACSSPEDYFTGKAHPSVFEGSLIDEVAMVKLAQAMTPGTLPPLAHVRALSEDEVKPGRDFFEAPGIQSERLADSPSAISRVMRGPAHRRTMRVTAADSGDALNRPLTYRWVVLRGDPAAVSVKPMGELGVEAEISVAYQARQPIAAGSAMESNRVDIAVFAMVEGSLPSAPAFVCFNSLPNEHRTYDQDGRLVETFYGARNRLPGVPADDSERWDSLLAWFDMPGPERPAGARLLIGALKGDAAARFDGAASGTKDSRGTFAEKSKQLREITAKQQKAVDEANKVRNAADAQHKKEPGETTKAALDAAVAAQNAARKAQTDGAGGAAELKKESAALRESIVAALRKHRLPEEVREGIEALRSDPGWFSKNEAAIRSAGGPLNEALERLKSVGIEFSGDPPVNERYHLEQFNLDVIAGVLFPQFLQRPPALNYADPRLTAAKNWRDVYRYAENGTPDGWVRHSKGQRMEFTAEGARIVSRKPDGAPDGVVAVKYEFDPATKHLEMKDAEGESAPRP